MAKASSYDEWEDVGMAFSDTEVAEWDCQAFASQRADQLILVAKAWKRYADIPGMSAPRWAADCSKRLVNVASWYCRALVVPGIDTKADLEMPDIKSAEGKKLTQVAQGLDIDGWVEEYAADIERMMFRVVTIGRRASSRSDWGKAQAKQSNKLANCVHQEINLYMKLRDEWNSHSGQGKEDE